MVFGGHQQSKAGLLSSHISWFENTLEKADRMARIRGEEKFDYRAFYPFHDLHQGPVQSTPGPLLTCKGAELKSELLDIFFFFEILSAPNI